MSHKASALPIGVSKVKFSFRSHVLPPFAGLLVMAAVYALLNLPLLVARTQYYLSQFTPPKLTIASAPAATPISNLSQIIIPSINAKAPIIYTASANNSNIAYDLRSGVVHYGTTALPGEKGNVVIFGHSSGVAWAPGNYKFVFTLLEKLQAGQQVSLDYNGMRYVYVVTDRKVVSPSDMSVLESHGQSQLTLITCTPVGTSKNRLVVHAKQISPNPDSNKPFTPSGNLLSEIPSGN